MKYPIANIKITDEGIILDIIYSEDDIEVCGYILFNDDTPKAIATLLQKIDGKIMKIQIDGEQATDEVILSLEDNE
jgi:hypothetical protein